MRGFEKITSEKNEIILPKRGSQKSAGYDFYILEDIKINAGDMVKIKTSVKAYMQDDEFLEIHMRSSLGVKGLMLANVVGIIDADYYNNTNNEGEIMFFIKNTSENHIKLNKNDRICQGIFKKYLTVDEEEKLNERTGGFGSTK